MSTEYQIFRAPINNLGMRLSCLETDINNSTLRWSSFPQGGIDHDRGTRLQNVPFLDEI